MQKKKRFIYLALAVILTGAILWVVRDNIRAKNQAMHEQARNLVKLQLRVTDDDIRGSCIYPEDQRFAFVVLGQIDYFFVKNKTVKVYDTINRQTKEKYPDLSVDDEFDDFYWVLENCQ